MKLNRFHLIAGIGIIASLVLIGSFFLFMFRSNFSESKSQSTVPAFTQNIQKNLSLSDLKLLEPPARFQFNTAADITFQQGPFSIIVYGDPQTLERLDIQSVGTHISIRTRSQQILPSGNSLEIQISIPYIEAVSFQGAGKMQLIGFQLDELELELDGAGTIMLEQGRVDQLTLKVRGVGKIDTVDFISTNSFVHLEGASSVSLHMGGGVLHGSIEGLGRLHYWGNVLEETVTIRGLGSVRYMLQ